MLNNCLLAQITQVRVRGNVIFKPRVREADVQLVLTVNGRNLGQRSVDPQYPFYFDHLVRVDSEDALIKVEKVIFVQPQNYTVDYRVTDLTFHGQRMSIYAVRIEDLAYGVLENANNNIRKKDYDTAIQGVEELNSYKIPIGRNQKFELYFALGKAQWEKADYSAHQNTLLSLYKEIEYNKLDETRKERYERERLDGIMRLANYEKLKLPEEDFGNVIFEDPDKLNIWLSFVQDLGPKYLDEELLNVDEVSPQIITSQLKKFKAALNRE